MSSEIKVTECYVEEGFRTAGPTLHGDYVRSDQLLRPAVLMWKEDYEQLKAKADAAEFVESVNNAISKSRDVYFAKLTELLPKDEMSRLIDEANK